MATQQTFLSFFLFSDLSPDSQLSQYLSSVSFSFRAFSAFFASLFRALAASALVFVPWNFFGITKTEKTAKFQTKYLLLAPVTPLKGYTHLLHRSVAILKISMLGLGSAMFVKQISTVISNKFRQCKSLYFYN